MDEEKIMGTFLEGEGGSGLISEGGGGKNA